MSTGNCPHVRYSPCLVVAFGLTLLLCGMTQTPVTAQLLLCTDKRCFSKPQLCCVGRITALHTQNNPKSTRQAPGILWDCCLTYTQVRQNHSRRIPSPVYFQQAWKSWMYRELKQPGFQYCPAASHKKAAKRPPDVPPPKNQGTSIKQDDSIDILQHLQ